VERASQSRHFSLHWVEHPSDWLLSLEATAPVDTVDHWRWIASHHQLLTLAKRSERETGLSVLWFKVLTEPSTPILFGAVLPGDRVALIPRTCDAETAKNLKVFLFSKMKIRRLMGATSDLAWLKGSGETPRVIERQTAWGKSLSTGRGTNTGDLPVSLGTECRRATEADRARIHRWARLFAIDTATDPEATTLECFEWLRRGRLLIFEDRASEGALGMAALSGEYNCPRLGRIGRLSLVFIDPNHRGRGYGHTMLQAIEEEMRLEKIKGVVLYSDQKNERIRSLYSDLGFKPFEDWLEVETKS